MIKKIVFFLTAICFAALSCTKDKTDYEAEIDTIVPEYGEFKEAASVISNGYTISIEALNGTFFKGYNEIRLKITNSQTNKNINASAVTFLPILSHVDGSTISSPHRFKMDGLADEHYYSGYSIFSSESNVNAQWAIYISFTINNETYSLKQNISVKEQANKNLNMTEFIGRDDEQYFIALVSPQKPKIAENELVAGIYKYNKPTHPPTGSFPDPSQFSYTEVSDYTLQLDPRMPDPSMGNHSSPNNKDLRQQSNGLYYGVVNYTMTGNWTLNFIMLNPDGKIIKGTEVLKDFTPGVEGVKSELFIDVLF